MKLNVISSLEKVFANKNEYGKLEKLSLLKNERGFFGVHFENDAITRFFFNIVIEGNLKDYITVYKAEDVPCTVTYQDEKLKDDYVISHERSLYPDVLKKQSESKFSLARSVNYGFYAEVYSGDGLPVGVHDVIV